MPATYWLTGYGPTVMPAHSLPFLSAGVNHLAYATIPTYAAAAAQLHGSAAYDSVSTNVGSDAATTSELSPGSTQNGVVENSGAGDNYTPPGYGKAASL